jgi:hypothetical protein
MPNIIDVIARTHYPGGKPHYCLILDVMPKHVYARRGEHFIAHDDGFYDFLAGRAGVGDAFAGREFHINLEDGTTFHCQGQVWSSGHGGHVSEPVVEVGVATVEALHKCYVFMAGCVSAAKLQAWLDNNTPSGNYYKYDPKHTVEWLDEAHAKYSAGNRSICAKRARQLRRRGVRIFKDETGRRSWSPSYERRKAAILKANAL